MARSLVSCRLASALVGVALTLLMFRAPLGAQFINPIQASSSAANYTNPHLQVGSQDGVVILFGNPTNLFVTSSFLGFGNQLAVTQNATPSTSGKLATGASLLLQVAYEEPTQVPGHTGVEVLLRNNNGGMFGAPTVLSANDGVDDTLPCLVIGSQGHVDVAWQSQVAGFDPEIQVSRNQGVPLLVASGAAPSIADLGAGVSYICYLRAGLVYGRTFDGASAGPEETLVGTGSNQNARIASDALGAVYVVYRAGTQLRSLRRAPGGLLDPSELRDVGPVSGTPDLAARAAGEVALVYTRGGQIWYQGRNTSGVWGTASNVTSFTTSALAPTVDLDSLGHAHVAYQLFGAIYYTSNTPAPVAEFLATTPTNGLLPHTVSFANQSTGVISSVHWNFGDGTTSTSFDAVHEFRLPGMFTVTLTVTGLGGQSTKVRNNYVSTTLPPNVLRIPHIQVIPGQQGVIQPINATVAVPIQGFQLAMQYDATVLPVSELTLNGSITGALNPDFFFVEFTPDMPMSTIVCAVVLDSQSPFTGAVIPPGPVRTLAGLYYDVPAGLPVGSSTEVVMVNGLGVDNIFSPGVGASIYPYLLAGRVTVVDPAGAVLFKRGDANRNGSIDIADAIYVLAFLFSGGSMPSCPDSADANDSGAVDIADAIFMLTYLFNQGPSPPYPFPSVGLDPTPDGLGPCTAL